MYKNLSMVHEALKDAIEQALTPYEKSSLVYQMINEPRVSHRQAFRAVHISSSIQRYKETQAKNDPLITLLHELVEKYLPKESHSFSLGSAACVTGGTTRTYIACVQPINSLSAGEEKAAASAETQALFKPDQLNKVSSVYFMAKSLWNGRKFNLLNIVDDFNCEILHIEADTYLP